MTVETTDNDTGENAQVSVELDENPGWICSVTGEVLVVGSLDTGLDRDTNVGINIQDQADNVRLFDQAEYEMIIPPTSSAVSTID